MKEAVQEDVKNGNTLWSDAIFREIQALQDFKTFKILARDVIGQKGKEKNLQWVPLRMIFDMKGRS